MPPSVSNESTDSAVNLAFVDVTYSIRAKKATRLLLDGLSGWVNSSRLKCVMGPSGSGKSTLLNVLTGRVSEKSLRGSSLKMKMLINGKTIDPTSQTKHFAYVKSEDALLATVTPREAFTFAAKMRLTQNSTKRNQAVVDQMIKKLGLESCADTLIGNELIKGVSSGERKRAAVGVSLIDDPSIIFMDEPTSGLDSYSAFSLVSLLKELSAEGRIILCSIHQPSSEVFHLFDDCMFLRRGKCVYQGPVLEIVPSLASLNLICPETYNPSDFLMYTVETTDDETIERMISAQSKASLDLDLPSQAPIKNFHLPPLSQANFFVQFGTLLVREFRNTYRDKTTLRVRFAATVFLNLLFGIVYFNVVEKETKKSGRDVSRSHLGAVSLIGINAMFSQVQATLMTFPLEKSVYLVEHAAGMYSTTAYFLAKTSIEIPVAALQTLSGLLVSYHMMGLVGDFTEIYLGAFLLSVASASACVMAGCFARSPKTAMEAGPLLFIPQTLFAGIFIAIADIPLALRWVQYLCALKYAMNMIMTAEFADVPGGSLLLEQNEVDQNNYAMNALALLGLATFFRIVGIVGLKLTAKTIW